MFPRQTNRMRYGGCMCGRSVEYWLQKEIGERPSTEAPGPRRDDGVDKTSTTDQYSIPAMTIQTRSCLQQRQRVLQAEAVRGDKGQAFGSRLG